MINIEQVLAQPLAETFTIQGLAPNVIIAHNLAWTGLEDVLADDPIRAWKLSAIQHVHSTDPQGVVFVAEFSRNPHYEIEQVEES